MDPEVVITEASAPPPPPEPVVAPEPKPLELEEFVHKQYEQHEATLAAAESKPEEKPAEPEAKAAEAAKVVPPEQTETPKTQEPPFTEAELGDGAFLGRLDAEGWKKLETYNPSLHKAAKAVARAQGTVFELKRQLEAKVNARPEPEAKVEPQTDPYEDAVAKTDSLDPAERAEGFRTLARLEAEKIIKERDVAVGFDPLEAQAQAAERSAYRLAVRGDEATKFPAMPELAELPSAELDAAVEADPELMDDVAIAVTLEGEARTRLLAKVMRRAGKIVIDKRSTTKAAADADAAKKAKDEKDAAAQKRLRSNEDNPSKVVVETPNGKPPKSEKTIEETVREKVAALR